MKRLLFSRFLLVLVLFSGFGLASCGGISFNFSASAQATAGPLLADAAFDVIDLVENNENKFEVLKDSILFASDAIKLVKTLTASQSLPTTVQSGHVLVSILYNKQGVESQDVYNIKTGKAGLGIILQGGETFESLSGNSAYIDATHTRQITIVPLQNAVTRVKISASRGWQNTGIFLKRGRAFAVRYVSGTWTSRTGVVGTSDAAGQPVNAPSNLICNCGEPLPGYSTQALIGRIGNGIGYTPLQVGDNFSGVSYDNEFLYLRINLPDSLLSHSSGTLKVEVQTYNG